MEMIKERSGTSLRDAESDSGNPHAQNLSAKVFVSNEELDRLREFGSQASDAATEVLEPLLDTAFATIEIFRAKLAEQRAQREKALAERREADQKRAV